MLFSSGTLLIICAIWILFALFSWAINEKLISLFILVMSVTIGLVMFSQVTTLFDIGWAMVLMFGGGLPSLANLRS